MQHWDLWFYLMMTSSLCFCESVCKTCQRQPTELKLGKRSFKVPQNMQNWKPYDKKWRHNDIITKNNGETRTSVKPNKLYIIRNVLMRVIQKCTFYWIWGHYVKSYGHLCQILAFLRCPLSKYGHVTWPKKQISKKIYFFLILHLILGKVTVEKPSTSEVISQPRTQGIRQRFRPGCSVKLKRKRTKSALGTRLVISQKPYGGCGKHPPQYVLLGLICILRWPSWLRSLSQELCISQTLSVTIPHPRSKFWKFGKPGHPGKFFDNCLRVSLGPLILINFTLLYHVQYLNH